MQAAASYSESQLRRVPIAITAGRRLRVAGVLKARPTLEEVPFVPLLGDRQARKLRAFVVHGPALERRGARGRSAHHRIDACPADRYDDPCDRRRSIHASAHRSAVQRWRFEIGPRGRRSACPGGQSARVPHSRNVCRPSKKARLRSAATCCGYEHADADDGL